MTFLFGFALGFLLGCIVAAIAVRVRRPIGILKIDTSDPGKDLYLFELGESLDVLPNCKVISLKVEHTKISHE